MLEWQLHMEHASEQAEVAVKPHVLDTALRVLMQEGTLERKRKREDVKTFD